MKLGHEANSFSGTDLSVLLCAALLLVLCLGDKHIDSRHTWVRNCRTALLVGIWYWTTTTWATETKHILTTFTSDRNEPGFPLLGFWLTFIPVITSSVICILGLRWRYGDSFTQEMHSLRERGSSFWFLAGAAQLYGQFFTVQSLIFGSAALTFIVKAAEPLSTALMAVLVLRRVFSFPLVLGISLACFGIAVAVLSAGSASGASSTPLGSHGQLAGTVFALLGNLGFSSRACVAKKALSQLHVDAFETSSMLTLAGAQVGTLPFIAYALASHVGGGAIWSLPFLDPRFSARSWLVMCLSYMIYQSCSVLILSSFAVESHALLVAMKHLVVVVLVSILVHAHLSKGIMLGMALTSLGVYLYIYSAKDDASMANESEEEEPLLEPTPLGQLPKKPANVVWKAPALLRIIVLVVVLLGCATPPILAAVGLRSAADL